MASLVILKQGVKKCVCGAFLPGHTGGISFTCKRCGRQLAKPIVHAKGIVTVSARAQRCPVNLTIDNITYPCHTLLFDTGGMIGFQQVACPQCGTFLKGGYFVK